MNGSRWILATAAALAIGIGAVSRTVRSGATFLVYQGTPVTTPVSITAIGDSGFLVSDYRAVHLFDVRAARMTEITVERPAHLTYRPTDTAFDPGTATVYIANYTGNDVLVGRLNRQRARIKVERRIKDGQTISPEGVAISGGMLAIANYDGNNVQVFDADAAEGTAARCTIPVRLAHGITFAGPLLYATSLADRQILKIDPVACRIVAITGSEGWRRGQFLYPTSVARDDDKTIVVADAHTGMISQIDTASMSVTATWGGNGPGALAFNMPYGVERDENAYFVASTFGQTIFSFTDRSWSGAVAWTPSPRWLWRPSFEQGAMLHNQGYSLYTSSASVQIRGSCYHPGYAAMHRCDGRRADINIPSIEGAYVYFLQAARTRHGAFVFSPQNAIGLYFDDDGRAPIQIRIGEDHWLSDGEVVGPNGRLDPPALLAAVQ
jgi:DNA-binding beta-propeller fold protein YncE